MQFSDLSVGHKARVTAFSRGDVAYRRRLLAMGLVPGTEFTVIRMAPLGDPVEILVRGCALSVRKAEASVLQIEVLS